MATTLVFTKDLQTSTFTADLGSQLLAGETLASVAEVALSPVTTPSLDLGVITVTSPAISVPIAGGLDGTSYGVTLRCTTSTSRVFDLTLAVLVTNDLTVPYATKNPYAFQALLGSIEAGDAGIGKALFTLPPTLDGSAGYVTWELLDTTGTVYSSGNAYSFLYTPGTFQNVIEAEAVINVPSHVPGTLQGQAYQVRWTLIIAGQPNQHAYEAIQVTSGTTVPLGASQAVEMAGDAVQMQLIVARAYPDVSFSVNANNRQIVASAPSTNPKRVAGGWLYTALLNTADSTTWPASLNPYQVLWRYKDTHDPTPTRETGRLFLLNSSMMDAIIDVESMVMKARTTIDGSQDRVFDPATIMTWLRRGRDMFNAAGGIITDFTMTNATGIVREMWLRYSEISALRAQYLAEGEKAFNFSGQNISLDVDRTQYFSALADSLQNEIDGNIATLKKNLQIKGILGGDGDVAGKLTGITPGAMGAVGIQRNAVSPNYPYPRSFFRG